MMISKEKILQNLLNQHCINIVKNSIESSNYFNENFSMHPKEFDMFKMNNIQIPEDDLSINYKYNEQGFRSDSLNEGSSSILFVGCSEGEGIGSSLETLWSRIVFHKIKDLFDADKFLNLSVDNFGYQKIISNCISYINNYELPKAIVILFPDLTRTVTWDIDNHGYTVEWTNIYDVKEEIQVKHIMDNLMYFIGQMHLFEEYCKAKNIPLFWSTWSNLENSVIEELGVFDFFIPFDYTIYKNTELEKHQIRRDGHQGEYYHNTWATNIYNYIINSMESK